LTKEDLVNPRRHARHAIAAASALLLVGSLAACTGQARAANEIEFWTVLTGDLDIKAQEAVVAAFEKEYPEYDVTLVRKPNPGGAPNGDLTTSVAAVRGGSPADVYLTDRFAISQQAGVGLLENLQQRIDDEGGDLMDNYVAFAAQETQLEGNTYGLPIYTDTRGLYYNKKVLRDAGIDPDVLDPEHGPPTIDLVMSLAKKIDQKDDRGNYTRMGFIPWDGQAFNATWGLQKGAKYFDNKTCELVPQEPAFQRTYEDFAKWSKQLDYERVMAFLATYRPPEQPPNQSPLYTGRIGMAIDGNWTLASIKEYAPDLDYGVTYMPVEKEGDDPFNWSGGFGLVMPKGAPNQDAAWTFMKYFTGPEGQKIYTTNVSQIPTWKSLLDDEEITGGLGVFVESLDYTVARPPLPVAAAFDGAMSTAQQAVLLGESTPEEALQNVYDRVGEQMKQFCPFTLPPKAVGID
jgi:multiple sugar transport system substrate-binding protein